VSFDDVHRSPSEQLIYRSTTFLVEELLQYLFLGCCAVRVFLCARSNGGTAKALKRSYRSTSRLSRICMTRGQAVRVLWHLISPRQLPVRLYGNEARGGGALAGGLDRQWLACTYMLLQGKAEVL